PRGRVDVNAMRLIQLRFQRRPADARRAFLTGAGHANNLPFSKKHFANQMIFGVGDDDVAVAVDAEVLGTVECSFKCVAVISAGTGLAGSDDGADPALWIHSAQGVAAAFEHVDVSFGINGNGPRVNERRVDRLGPILRYALVAVAGH